MLFFTPSQIHLSGVIIITTISTATDVFLCFCDRYMPLKSCLTQIPVPSMGNLYSWPIPWPQRLRTKPPSLSSEPDAEKIFTKDTKHWSSLVSEIYLKGFAINWSSVRNVMDMNANYGG